MQTKPYDINADVIVDFLTRMTKISRSVKNIGCKTETWAQSSVVRHEAIVEVNTPEDHQPVAPKLLRLQNSSIQVSVIFPKVNVVSSTRFTPSGYCVPGNSKSNHQGYTLCLISFQVSVSLSNISSKYGHLWLPTCRWPTLTVVFLQE